VSAGPDGKFGTDDDVKLSDLQNWNGWGWWLENGDRNAQQLQFWGMQRRGLAQNQLGMMGGGMDGAVRFGAPAGLGGGGGGFEGGMGGAMPTGAAMPPRALLREKAEGKELPRADRDKDQKAADGGGAKPVRLREYFPETMLWQPALITDDTGHAELPL